MISTEHVILVQVGTDSIFRETVQTRYNDLPPMGLITLAGFLQAKGNPFTDWQHRSAMST